MKAFIVCLLVVLSMKIVIAEDYHFVSIENLIEQDVGRIIIPEIYKKLGIDVTITPRPGKRAQKEATSGRADGEIMRIWTYGEENPTTVRVPTPYYYLETMGFVKKGSGVVINTKDDLKKYRLVKVRGVKHTNNISVGVDDVYDSASTELMMRFLNGGRADIALTNTVDGLMALRELEIIDIVPLEKPLAVLELYHYIHQDHIDLVSRVDTVIKNMKESGELEKLIYKAENAVISE